MIILLGPDNTGKTTLAKQLVQASKEFSSYHCSTKTEFYDYWDFLAHSLSLNTTIFDRWFFCDLPYAKVVRQEERSKFTYQQIHLLNTLTRQYKPLILLCTKQAKNFDAREQLATKEQHNELLFEYKRVLGVLQHPYIMYNWENPMINLEEILALHKNTRPTWLIKMSNSAV